MSATDTQADLTERVDGIIALAVNDATPHVADGTMLLHWRVQRALEIRIAAALQSEREAAAAEARRADIAGVLDCAINMLTDLASPPAPQEDKR